CPSNPFISIWPILAVEEIRAAVERRRVPSGAVRPLVGGRAIKGPPHRMLERPAGGPQPRRGPSCYAGGGGFPRVRAAHPPFAPGVEAQGVRAIVTRTLMRDEAAAAALAEVVLACA